MLRIENGAGLARRHGTTCFLPARGTIPSTSCISIRRTRHVPRNRLMDDHIDTRVACQHCVSQPCAACTLPRAKPGRGQAC